MSKSLIGCVRSSPVMARNHSQLRRSDHKRAAMECECIGTAEVTRTGILLRPLSR